MASDIPGMGYPSSLAMAKVLVTYMSCPHRVRRAILNEFDQAPGITTVERLRAEHLAPKEELQPLRSDRGHNPNKLRDDLTIANRAFIERLNAERARSDELRSHYLTRPALINAGWEREVRAARNQKTAP